MSSQTITLTSLMFTTSRQFEGSVDACPSLHESDTTGEIFGVVERIRYTDPDIDSLIVAIPAPHDLINTLEVGAIYGP
jgi:hypothetical protein